MKDFTQRPADRGGAFDDNHPPRLDLLADCVHCGFCLASCPTYSVLGDEMDSPRGRIHLMQQGMEGEMLTDSMVQHFDACLGCMACVPACPSGVQYDKLIEPTRNQLERRHRRSWRQKALRGGIFALFPYPRRIGAMRGPLWLYQRSGLQKLVRRPGFYNRMPANLRNLEAAAPTITRRSKMAPFTPAKGPRRAVVAVLTGCVQSAFFSSVNAATVRVLAADGCDVVVPKGQGCCGALSAHNGRPKEARRFARRTIDALSAAGVQTVIVNSAGCGSTMKDYADLLADEPAYAGRAAAFAAQVEDVAEFLHRLVPVATRHPLPVSVAYHDACHLSNAQGIRRQPRELLRDIPQLALREIPDGNLCCGSAGIYNLLQPQMAAELGQRKAANIHRTGAELVVAANPGCLLQVSSHLRRDGSPLALAHTIEVIDASIQGESVAQVLAAAQCF